MVNDHSRLLDSDDVVIKPSGWVTKNLELPAVSVGE